MTEQEYLTKIHKEIIEIMDVIHEICMQHHLKYYLTGGTLLGAVRHHGFIPWDDDLDIVMPRDDYDLFLEICKGCLPSNFSVINMNTSTETVNLISKICKIDTLFLSELNSDKQTSTGIFVDIFPMDQTNGNIKYLRWKKRIMWLVFNLIYIKNHSECKHGIKGLIANAFSPKKLKTIFYSIIYPTNNRNKRFYTNFASQYPVERKTQLKTVYGNGTPMQFEDRMYMAPDDYKTDLLSNFGPKYMELPPVEKRRTHYPLKVVFSDGSVFEPTSIKDNKVSVEESINW